MDSRDDEGYEKLIDECVLGNSKVAVILVSSKKAAYNDTTQDASRKRALEYVKRVPKNTPIIIVYSRVDPS